MDIIFTTAAITGVSTDALSKHFLNLGYKGMAARDIKTAEGDVSSGETTI